MKLKLKEKQALNMSAKGFDQNLGNVPLEEALASVRKARRPLSLTPSTYCSYGVDWGNRNLVGSSLNKKRGSWTGPVGSTLLSNSGGLSRSTDGHMLTTSNVRSTKMLSIVEKAAIQIDNSGPVDVNNRSINDIASVNRRRRKLSRANSGSGESISLSQVARYGNYKAVLSVLDCLGQAAQNQLNELNEDQLSPLHLAVRYNHPKVVQLLVERGAIVHIRGEDGLTPLHFAAKYNVYKRTSLKHETSDTQREDQLTHQFDYQILRDEVELRKRPRRKALNLTIPKSNQFINRKVKSIGKPLRKLRTKKGGKRNSMEDVLCELNTDVVLTGSSTTLEYGNNGGCTVEQPAQEDVILYLVSQMAELNSKDDFGLTPLHYAAMRGNCPAAKSLLTCPGVNAEARDAEEMTPLHLAAIHNNADIVQLLVSARAQLRCRDENMATPLHHAAAEGNLEIIKLLLTAAEDREGSKTVNEMANDKDCELALPLHSAVENGHYECANYLLSKGADMNIPKQGSVYPLHLAAKQGFVDMVRLLIYNNKKIDCKKIDGETPLHEAAKYNHVMVINILIQIGADVECKDNNGFTPLLTAAYHGNVEAIEAVLSLGAKLHTTDKDDKTAIYWATAQNKHDALMALLDESPRSQDLIKSSDRYGNSPLHVATLKGFAVITQCLLDLGAPIEIRNDMDQTPLHLAAWHGRIKIVKDLLWRSKSGINHVDEDGNTPLHIAALLGHDNVVKLFIEAGASLDLKNSRLWTPLDCAATRGHVNTVRQLLESGCPIEPQERMRVTPLHLAAANGNVEVVTLLLEHGADITRRDDQMRNPLEIAIDNFRKDIARAIVNSDQWEKALRCGFIDENGLMKTPLRKLIVKMPDIAEEVFQRCSSNNGLPSDHPLYAVSFNYEFIDDTSTHFEKLDQDDASSLKVKSMNNHNNTDQPRPTGDQQKSNHPLMIMVNSKRVHLLTHPLCVSLLHLKWAHFGRYVYYTNFIVYLVFLISLTGYILSATPPISAAEATNGSVSISSSNNDNNVGQPALVHLTCPQPDDYHEPTFVQTSKYVVIVLATLHLLKECFQIFTMRWSYFGLENLTELTCFVSSLLLVLDISKCSVQTGIREKWQWEAGTIAIFFAWMNLVMFISKFPYLGLYVVMFGDVLRTFCKVCVVFFLFIVAFAMGFYTVFYYNPSYSSVTIAIVRVMVMMLGEFQFDDIYQSSSLVYPGPAFFLFFLFMILVCILTMNLLVGLAVDDIKTVQAQANLKRLAMQVELVLNVESMMPKFLQQRFVIKECSFVPNRRKEHFFERLLNTESLSEILVSSEKYRDSTSGVYRCKMSEITKVMEQQDALCKFSKGLENNINTLQNESKQLQHMLMSLLHHNGVQLNEEASDTS